MTVFNTNPQRIFVAIPETYKFVPVFTVLTALLLVFMHAFQVAHYYIHSSHYQVHVRPQKNDAYFINWIQIQPYFHEVVILQFKILFQDLENLWWGPYPSCSNLIFDSENKAFIWRFVTYAYVHKGIEHCLVNTIFLLLVGIPLEMVHGGGR